MDGWVLLVRITHERKQPGDSIKTRLGTRSNARRKEGLGLGAVLDDGRRMSLARASAKFRMSRLRCFSSSRSRSSTRTRSAATISSGARSTKLAFSKLCSGFRHVRFDIGNRLLKSWSLCIYVDEAGKWNECLNTRSRESRVWPDTGSGLAPITGSAVGSSDATWPSHQSGTSDRMKPRSTGTSALFGM